MRIPHVRIPDEVKWVSETLTNANFEAYLVGGCVRDLLRNAPPKDWDLTTNAHPADIQKLFPSHYANNDFGTIGVKTESENPRLQVIEVTPYRSESGYSDLRRPDAVRFGVSLEEDLARRDFTVNALAYSLKDENIIDIFNGIDDLHSQRLKTVGEPHKRFQEDALRMMRAVRLAAELEYVIDGDTMNAIAENHQLLQKIAIERVASEFIRLLDSPAPMQGLIFLEKLGMLELFIPELRLGIGCEQGGIHAYDVFEHNLRTCQAAADKGYAIHLRLAGLFHDIAKPHTRKEGGKSKKYTFFGHEVVGARITKQILARLRIDKETSDIVVKLVRWHMFFADPDQITLSAVRRTIARIGENHIEDLLNLRVCDRIGTGRPKEQPFRFRKYKAMVDEALRDPISVKMLKINGDRLLEIANIQPGKRIGWVLHALLEEALDNPSKNNQEYMENRALELLKLPDAALEALAEAGKRKQAEEEEIALKDIARTHKVG
jgi:poly(A) polymerase/tRNA nucleotidyltransferase (CCA-adding enzyme)